jgi:hypothetical protein
LDEEKKCFAHLSRGRVVSSPLATKETGSMGREIESRQWNHVRNKNVLRFAIIYVHVNDKRAFQEVGGYYGRIRAPAKKITYGTVLLLHHFT